MRKTHVKTDGLTLKFPKGTSDEDIRKETARLAEYLKAFGIDIGPYEGD